MPSDNEPLAVGIDADPQSGPAKPVFPLRRRAKQQTREKLLGAARRLFTERGYEATTLRDVAAMAGCSTGAVFASFADKAELFAAVVELGRAALQGRLEALATSRGSIDRALLAVILVIQDVHIDEPCLLQASVSAPWRADLAAVRPKLDCGPMAVANVAGVLRRGIEGGVLATSLNVDVAAEMLWESSLSNCRKVVLEGWSRDLLSARSVAQIAILLAGFRLAAQPAAR